MNIVAVMVGVGQWEQYTLPAIESIQKSDLALKLLVVDNGGEKYPRLPNVSYRRYQEPVSYAAALNGGMFLADVGWDVDWYVLLNNDILLHKAITPRFAGLDPETLYGFQYFHNNPAFPADYLASWAWFLPRKVAVSVGEFDENLKPLWFEDADYCIRLQKLGYKMGVLDSQDWGLEHLEKDRRGYMAKHIEARKANRAYLLRKHGL